MGYIIIESGSGSIDDVNYVADLGADTVKGPDDAPPYIYSLSGLSSTSVAVGSQSGMDGSDGAWTVLYGSSPLSTTELKLISDEDQAYDAERAHFTEQVCYIVFE